MKLADLANYAQVFSIPLMVFLWLLTPERFSKFLERWCKLILLVLFLVTIFAAKRLGLLGWINLQIPIWILAAFLAFAFLCYWFFKMIAGRSKNPCSTGNVEGVDWNWRIIYGKFRQNSLIPICPVPTCRCQLDHQRIECVGNERSHRRVDHVKLVCRRCGFSRDFEYNWMELLNHIQIEVERRFRTGEYH